MQCGIIPILFGCFLETYPHMFISPVYYMYTSTLYSLLSKKDSTFTFWLGKVTLCMQWWIHLITCNPAHLLWPPPYIYFTIVDITLGEKLLSVTVLFVVVLPGPLKFADWQNHTWRIPFRFMLVRWTYRHVISLNRPLSFFRRMKRRTELWSS